MSLIAEDEIREKLNEAMIATYFMKYEKIILGQLQNLVQNYTYTYQSHIVI